MTDLAEGVTTDDTPPPPRGVSTVTDTLAADVAAVVDARLAARIEQARRRRETQRADRARRSAARAHGLRARHAQKLGRLAEGDRP